MSKPKPKPRNKPAPINSAPQNVPAEFQIDDGPTTRHLYGGIGRATHYEGMASGRYSKPIKISPNKNGYLRANTYADIARLAAPEVKSRR